MSTPPRTEPRSRAAVNDVLTDHQYDGIQEFDNPTPGWWSLVFLVTFVWACGYWVVYELNTTPPTIHQEWEAEVAEVNKVLFAKLGDLKSDDATLMSMSVNADWMSVGESLFRANCVACHAKGGLGDVGPNLVDDAYKNVKTPVDVARVVREGAGGQAMPAWRGRLSENEIILVSAYVIKLRGSATGGKSPEGEIIAPWPKTAQNPPGK